MFGRYFIYDRGKCRSALLLEEAYKSIIDGKGTQFDPDLVELFQKVYPSWKETH
ncbi:hypothetical protein ABEX66_18475 [Bacillus rhizoplanae]